MKRLLTFATLLAALPLLPLPAQAGQSVAVGGYTQSAPSKTGAAIMFSTGASIPAVPLEVQGTLMQALTQGGGYAATAEVRGFTGGGYGGAYVGAGAGVGNLSADRTAGTVLTVFAGKSIAPLTSVELRLYKQTHDSGATAGFVGLRFSF
ncbi:MAG TPA: hypothetical protein VFL13_15590 [Candidatus Baltobacteraceae bacterium]|nr:hypothetical protein [Candidatus Baltobacteraceae bacterium]